jgi:hypothetical protein
MVIGPRSGFQAGAGYEDLGGIDAARGRPDTLAVVRPRNGALFDLGGEPIVIFDRNERISSRVTWQTPDLGLPEYLTMLNKTLRKNL